MNASWHNSENLLRKVCYGGIVSVIISLSVSIIGMLLLWGAFSLPMERIRENVAKSTQVIAIEGQYPAKYTWAVSTLDNFTDALILLEAAYISTNTSFINSIQVPSLRMPGGNAYESLCAFTPNSREGEVKKCARYWHGYQIILKPFLLFGDYMLLRRLNFALQVMISLAVIVMMCWRKLIPEALAYTTSILLMIPPVIGANMQFSSIFYIFSISCLYLLCLDKKRHNSFYMALLFSLVGASTAFFDYLTYPIAAFGMPMTLSLCMHRDDTPTECFRLFFFCFVCWFTGYAVTWGLKWVFATIFTEDNIIADALNQISYRTSSTVSYAGEIGLLKMYGEVLKNFTGSPFIYASGGALILGPVLAILNNRRRLTLARAIPFLVIASMPFIWYAFTRNHSFIHSFFTCKGLVVTFFAIPCAAIHIWQRKDERQ